MKKIYIVLLLSTVFFGAKSQSTTLVISQVYGGGGNSGATYTHDFIEIFNKGTVSVNLTGFSVQHTSAAGAGTWNVTNLTSVTLLPGQYYLVQEAAGAGGSTPLPTPDATGSIAMGNNNGKVALVNNTTALSGSCPSSASIIDLVGWGSGASCSEGAIGPASSNPNSISRKLSGCQDTQDNFSDFTAGAAAPRNTASTFNVCSGSCTVPSQNASLLRMSSSTATGLSLLFSRGNGTGAIVLCRQAGAVNTTPVNGTTYTANSLFGSGSVINVDNYVVHSTTLSGVVGFNVTGLTAGTTYYFSVFEYNDPGKCYTSTGQTGSFTVGATILKPGDMVFVGWDAGANAGEDRLYLMNMVDIEKGTKFSIVNSRFEAGATANTRTNHWGGGGSDPWQDPDKQDFIYAGAAAIAKGSVISMESNSSSGFTSFTVNGASVPSSDFTATTGLSNFLSVTGTDADQLYIVQGTYKSFGTAGTDRYNLLDGLVIHGITVRTPWIPLTSAVSSSNAGGSTRQSRIPPEILCINTEFATSANTYANYTRAIGQTGTKAVMLGRLKNVANWTTGTGTTGNDVVAGDPTFPSSTYTISPSGADGNWNGTVSSDWFDCSNWEGLHVPDSTTAVVINALPTALNNCDINTTVSTNAVQFENIARADSVTVLNAAFLSLTGAGSEKLKLENSLNINIAGTFQFENNANAASDILYLHGSLRDSELSNNYISLLGFQQGQGTVRTEDTRFASNPAAFEKPTLFSNRFYNLVMNNSRGVAIKGISEVSTNLNLMSGYLHITAPDGKLTLKPTCTITSTINANSQINKGNKSSFVNGKLYAETDAATDTVVFPIGKITSTDTLYAPAQLKKFTVNGATYDAEYFPISYSDLAVDAGQLNHVSGLEYWTLNSDIATSIADAKVTLSWRPTSLVGNGIPANDAAALDSLVVAHYFDADGVGGNPFLWHIQGNDVTIMPKSGGATVSYGTVTTNLFNSPYSDGSNTVYFTLGTRSAFNLLPVKLLDFSATAKFGEVDLKWVTKEEKGLLYYEVERSKNAISFTTVDKVMAANGLATNNYYTTDKNPVTGWNYYRLKIVEAGGKVSYSTIVKAWIGGTRQLLVYPNPAQKEIKIILPGARSTSTIAIVNSAGQVVKQLATTEQSLTINIEFLNRGVYFIKVMNDHETIVQKFNKQ